MILSHFLHLLGKKSAKIKPIFLPYHGFISVVTNVSRLSGFLLSYYDLIKEQIKENKSFAYFIFAIQK